MSEKNEKRVRKTLNLPDYDIKAQLSYLTELCKVFEFSGDRLISLILGEWIYTVQKGLAAGEDMSNIFFAYLKKCEDTAKKFNKLKEAINKNVDADISANNKK